MKKLRGFSLAEMMVVLLIISIVAAAAAPMVNKRALSIAAERTPWVWTNQNNIAFGFANNANQTASIGAVSPAGGETPKLYVDSNNNTPHFLFGNAGASLVRLFASNQRILFTDTNIADPSTLTNVVSIGPATQAVSRSLSIGARTNAGGTDSIALGFNSQATGPCSIAIGTTDANNNNPQALGFASIAIGRGAVSSNQSTVAIGDRASAGFSNAVTVGVGATANGNNAVAIGPLTNAGQDTVSIGNQANQNNGGSTGCVAIGDNSRAFTASVAIGRSAQALSVNSVALGNTTTTTGVLSIAIGNGANTRGINSIAIGTNARAAAGDNAIALGRGATANFANSVAIGNGAVATGDNVITLGTSSSTVYIPGKLVVGNWLSANDIFSERYLVVSGQENTLIRRSGDDKFITPEYFGTNSYNQAASTVRGWDGPTEFRRFNSTAFSDRRLKNVGEAFKGGLEEIKKLEVFHYTFKKDPAKTARVGVMAQDLQKIFPDAVFKGEDGFLRIRMEDMFYAVVNAIKELDLKLIANDKKIEDLEKQNSELEKLIEEMEAQVKQLKK